MRLNALTHWVTWLLVFWLASFLTHGSALVQEPLPVPALSARVIDQTATPEADLAAVLAVRLARFESGTGAQIVVLTVPAFRRSDFAGGLHGALNLIFARVRGETPEPPAPQLGRSPVEGMRWTPPILAALVVLATLSCVLALRHKNLRFGLLLAAGMGTLQGAIGFRDPVAALCLAWPYRQSATSRASHRLLAESPAGQMAARAFRATWQRQGPSSPSSTPTPCGRSHL